MWWTSEGGRVVSGGQTGAGQAGLRAARSAGIPTGGRAPKGWATEAGPAPWVADFGLVECPEPGYRARTAANVRDSDGTLWFGAIESRGFRATHDEAIRKGIHYPFMIVWRGTEPVKVADWIRAKGVRVLNVAGNRESVNPGIGERVERFLAGVFRAGGWAGRGVNFENFEVRSVPVPANQRFLVLTRDRGHENFSHASRSKLSGGTRCRN